MQYASDSLFQCPHCGNYIKNRRILSGNTFGTIMYSDGKGISPMLPELPVLIKCKKCSNFIWLNKLKENYDDKFQIFPEDLPRNADMAEFLTIEEYFSALRTAVSDAEEELFVRRQIFWSYNDRIRRFREIFDDENDEVAWKDNCEKLMMLLDASDLNQKILMAELNRNLGNFEECKALIKSITVPGLSELKKVFLSECKKKNKWVFRLP